MNKLKIAFRTEKYQSDILVMDAPKTDAELGAVVRTLATARRHTFDRYDNTIAANPSIEQDSGISVMMFEARSDDWMAAEAAIAEAKRKESEANQSRYNSQREAMELKKNIESMRETLGFKDSQIDALSMLARPGMAQLLQGLANMLGAGTTGTSVASDGKDTGDGSNTGSTTQASRVVEPTPPECHGD